MTDLTDHAIYAKHPIRPSTPEAEVQSWKRAHGWFICERLNAGMTEAACRRKRREARLIKKYVTAQRLPVVSAAFHEAEICLKCREYPR